MDFHDFLKAVNLNHERDNLNPVKFLGLNYTNTQDLRHFLTLETVVLS